MSCIEGKGGGKDIHYSAFRAIYYKISFCHIKIDKQRYRYICTYRIRKYKPDPKLSKPCLWNSSILVRGNSAHTSPFITIKASGFPALIWSLKSKVLNYTYSQRQEKDEKLIKLNICTNNKSSFCHVINRWWRIKRPLTFLLNSQIFIRTRY